MFFTMLFTCFSDSDQNMQSAQENWLLSGRQIPVLIPLNKNSLRNRRQILLLILREIEQIN